MNVPDLIQGRVVPSTVQLYGETFHREKNLDACFERIRTLEQEMKRLRDGHRIIVVDLKSEVASLKIKLRDEQFTGYELLDALKGMDQIDG